MASTRCPSSVTSFFVNSSRNRKAWPRTIKKGYEDSETIVLTIHMYCSDEEKNYLPFNNETYDLFVILIPIFRARSSTTEVIAEGVRQEWSPPAVGVVHWDGKLLPSLQGGRAPKAAHSRLVQ